MSALKICPVNLNIPPLQFAAIGAAAGFYLLPRAHYVFIIACFIILLILVCLVRVLSSLDAQSRKLYEISFCSAVFIVGLSFGISAANAGRNDVNLNVLLGDEVGIGGVLLEDPRIITSGNAMASVSLHYYTIGNNLRLNASGNITVFFPAESAYRLREFGRGTTIFAEGSVRSTQRGESFSARSLHIVKPAPAIEQFRNNIRLNLIDRFGKEKWGGLALALLLGIRDNLDTDLALMYRSAGLSYILALSGMHLAIIAALISFLLKKPLGLKGCAIAGAFIIVIYCLLVGPMPSLNRSALMYLLGVFAILGALPQKAMSILSLSFLIQIFITPAAGNTFSFILSYLALVGILLTSKALSFLLAGKIPEFLLQPLSISCGAFLATAGVCAYAFGIIAPVGIIASLVIVPLTTIFMIGSIIWLFLDFISLSFILDFPLSLLYRSMEITASVSGNIPGITGAPLLILLFSIALSLLIIILEKRQRTALLQFKMFS